MLAAGLLTAGTVLTAAGAASADAAAVHRAACTVSGNFYFSVTAGSVSYFLGTPNKLSSGAAAILKPTENSTTLWTACGSSAFATVLTNRGLALTTRASSPGANVTLTPPGNGGNGFASQQWNILFNGSTYTILNVKTGLFLRVRNSGPIMGQTVTTGSTSTAWTLTPAAGTFTGHR
jgi:hypothetical protein